MSGRETVLLTHRKSATWTFEKKCKKKRISKKVQLWKTCHAGYLLHEQWIYALDDKLNITQTNRYAEKAQKL